MKKYIAEFVGTFALVFCGTGAVIVNSLSAGSLGLIGVSAAFGIIITAMIYVFGSISGTFFLFWLFGAIFLEHFCGMQFFMACCIFEASE